MDDELAKILLLYFFKAHQVIDKMAGGRNKFIAGRAFYDTLGGYLKFYMNPISKYSFYAGLIKLKSVENIFELYEQCKQSLNTNGNGWRNPITDFTEFDMQIEPVKIIVHNKEEDTSCTQLDLLDERGGEDEDIIVSFPRLDPQERGLLGNIWLPFKRKRTFDLQSSMSAFVFLRYFELTTRCYTFQGICQESFNRKLKAWILENLEFHLTDDILYPGLGALLRVIETLRRKSKDAVIIAKTKRQRLQQHQTEDREEFLRKHAKFCPDSVFAARRTDSAEDADDPENTDDYEDEKSRNRKSDEEDQMDYIYLAILIAILLLIIVILSACLLKRRRSKAKPPDHGSEGGKLLICAKDSRTRIREDEEVLLGPESSSIASSHKPKSKPKEKPRHVKESTSEPLSICPTKSKETKPLVSFPIPSVEPEREAKRESKQEVKTELEPESEPKVETEEEEDEESEPKKSKKKSKRKKDKPARSPRSSSSSPTTPKCFVLCTKSRVLDSSSESAFESNVQRKSDDSGKSTVGIVDERLSSDTQKEEGRKSSRIGLLRKQDIT